MNKLSRCLFALTIAGAVQSGSAAAQTTHQTPATTAKHTMSGAAAASEPSNHGTGQASRRMMEMGKHMQQMGMEMQKKAMQMEKGDGAMGTKSDSTMEMDMDSMEMEMGKMKKNMDMHM